MKLVVSVEELIDRGVLEDYCKIYGSTPAKLRTDKRRHVAISKEKGELWGFMGPARIEKAKERIRNGK